MKKAFAAVMIALLAVPAGAGASSDARSLGDLVEREMVAAARRAGIDVRTALDLPQTVSFVRADGTSGERAVTARSLIEDLRGIPMTQSAAPGMVDGVPEIVAGDLTHAYIHAGIGISTRYSVTRSAVVPSTPGFVVSDPVTGLPLFTEYGGPLTQVKGGGWLVGLHGAGFGVGGLNVDLADGGPYVAPAAFSILEDETIDFIGHGSVTESCLRLPFLGCVVALGLLNGDGLTIFDSELPADIPVLP